MSVSARSSSAKRDWGSDDSGTPILHVDMDSFFAAVEVLEDPELEGKPVIVGGLGNRGVVTSATYPAREKGVRAGQPMRQARSRCPEAVVVPGRHGLYREYSKRVMALLGQITDVVEPLSIDEAFLDVSGARRRLGPPVHVANLLRRRMRQEIGLPISVGIASTKSVAKIASAHAKPDGVLLIPAEQTVTFLHSLPIGALWGVGRQTESMLKVRGIDTIGQLAHTDISVLSRWIGETGAYRMHDLAWGRDDRSVGPRPREKSISTERTFGENLIDRSDLERFVLYAAHQCARRLREAELLGWTVTLKLRDAKFATITRSKTLVAPTDVGRVIAQAAHELLRRERIPQGGIRLAGVGVSGLASDESGVPVLLDEDPRDRNTELVMDLVSRRFGADVLKPASLIKTSGRDPGSRTGEPDDGSAR